MSTDRKRIALLLGRDGATVEAAVRRMARSHGFDITAYDAGERVLAEAPFDLLVADDDVPGRWTGVELLEALRELDQDTRVVLIGTQPGFEACRRALRLGATDFLTTPVVLPELFAAIDRATSSDERSRLVHSGRAGHSGHSAGGRHARSYTADAGAVDCAARDLLAFLVQHGIGPSHRLRVASAVAEVVDNACRHAYRSGDAGLVRLRAALAGDEVVVDVEDGGEGFDATSVARDGEAEVSAAAARAIGSGLVRARRLSDELDVDSDREGTRVRLRFALHPLAFDEDSGGYTEIDFLAPGEARRLLRELARDRADDPVDVPPSLLPTVGRLLAAFDLDPLAIAPRS